MRVDELYKQVAQLGFEDSLEDDSRFYYAANRALLQVSSLRPHVSFCVIYHKPMKNLIEGGGFEPVERGEELCFSAEGPKAYYFEADGNGELYIEVCDGGTWTVIGYRELVSSGSFVAYRGFIKRDGDFLRGSVRLRFSGKHLYSVKCVALYEHIYSDAESDIPAYEAYTRYDISRIVPDFLSLSSPPIDEERDNERMSEGYELEGGSVILLPHSKRGSFKVLYNRRPRELKNTGVASEDDTLIDLDEELCSLLPMLIASYVWVEDEPSMAEYYLSLYRERALDITQRQRCLSPVEIKNRNGW